MRYSIAFKNLPFEPEKRQVIYVENQYDERINAIIKEKYDWLKYQFKHANLDFVYLPMFFNDEEIKEIIGSIVDTSGNPVDDFQVSPFNPDLKYFLDFYNKLKLVIYDANFSMQMCERKESEE